MLNPHCDHCREERNDSLRCRTCEVLDRQLDQERHVNKQLLAQIERMHHPVSSEPDEMKDIEPVPPAFIPWRHKQRLLEEESRREFELREKIKREDELNGEGQKSSEREVR